MYLQSKRWGYVANAWEAHRLAIMGDMPHWYLWAIAVVPEGSAEGARTYIAATSQLLQLRAHAKIKSA